MSQSSIRPSTGNSTKKLTAVNFDNAISLVAGQISDSMPGMVSLEAYFNGYDAYESRIFSSWELQMMYPKLDSSVFRMIHEQNQKK